MSQAFYLPTRVFSGKGCVVEHSGAFAPLGKKALIVTGRRSAKANGSEADVRAALEKEGIAYAVWDEAPTNPGIADARAGAKAVREAGADFVVGIGGGSPIDAAKAIAVLAANELDDEAVFANVFPVPPLPIVAVPTTAGTGSEVTQYSILTNDAAETKSAIAHEGVFPRLAFLNHRYTAELPRRVTVNTALDALSHSVEGYLARRATPYSDALAVQAMALSAACLRELVVDVPIGEDLRERLLRASTLAGMVIAHTGTTAGHALGYSLTYSMDIDHGRANALIMGAYLEFLAGEHPGRVAEVLSATGSANLAAFAALLDSLIEEREAMAKGDAARFAAVAAGTRNIANTIRSPSEQDLAAIYEKSLR